MCIFRYIRRAAAIALTLYSVTVFANNNTNDTANSVQIAKFRDNKIAAISMSLSDSTPDHFLIAAPVLTKHGMRATFFTITSERSETLGNLHILDEGGHEIASHTMTHCPIVGATEDIILREVKGSQELLEANSQQKVVTFGYPNGERSEELTDIVNQYYLYQAPRLVNFGGADFTLADAMRIIDIRIANQDALMICFHGIHPDMEGWIPFSAPDLFEQIVVAIKDLPETVWRGMTLAELMQYTTLCDNCTITEQTNLPDHYQFLLRLPDDMARYQGNVTLLVRTAVLDPEVKIDNKPTAYTRLVDGRLMFDAPANSEIKITPKSQ